MPIKARTKVTDRGKDKQPEARPSKHLKMVMQATDGLPFSFTMFFTDEFGNSIKFGRFVKQNIEYTGG